MPAVLFLVPALGYRVGEASHPGPLAKILTANLTSWSAVWAVLEELPVVQQYDREQHLLHVFGHTLTLVHDILRESLQRELPHDFYRAECHCHLKTACTVAGSKQEWCDALEAAPFGSGVIHDDWPYLGADVAGPGEGAN